MSTQQQRLRNELIDQRIAAAKTHVVKAVFPFTTNHHETLFGGQALSWMDETAFIAATRFSRKSIVTVASDKVDFKHPIPEGTVVELVAEVIHVGNTSVQVEVNIFVESMYRDGVEKAITGVFSFVAIGEDKRPTPILEGFDQDTGLSI